MSEAGFTDFKKQIIKISRKLLHRIEREETLPSSVMKLIKKIFLPKADEGNMRKEDYRLIALMNTDTNSLNRILANRMKQDIKRQHIMVKLEREYIPEM